MLEWSGNDLVVSTVVILCFSRISVGPLVDAASARFSGQLQSIVFCPFSTNAFDAL